MKLIAEKYRQLWPTTAYLADEVIMAQAWKKTHTYMRTHNWYADTLALDISALSLEGNVRNWARSVLSPEATLEPLELIPAVKSDPWGIDKRRGWHPKKILKKRIETPPLRPLAHLTIRDQTWATAAMLCLADAVETAQGDCNENNFLIAQKKGVYSYGNRLLCDWKENGKAWFRWGNSQIYRKFFTDYQNFLRRPVAIGKELSQSQLDAERIFVVNLDLSKFYDNIDRTTLVKKLRAIIRDQNSEETEDFWVTFKKITDWRWSAESKKRGSELNLKIDNDNGIPQGLVAAGFFANAYLVDFDMAVGKILGEKLDATKDIVLHDYCRYVDDIRLVVSVREPDLYTQIYETVHVTLGSLLNRLAGEDLKFNQEKTRITSLGDLDNKGSVSARVAELQSELSGPADRDVLTASLSALEGLLTISEYNVPDLAASMADAPLARIAKFDHDVRTDTLKRFAANRLETVMRNKRKIEFFDNSDSPTEIDNQSELLAKKLIWAWMQDPSLALVLRKAFEVFPSSALAEPVFEAIFRRCSFHTSKGIDKVSAAMADYLLADLFRCCVDFHAYFQKVAHPSNCDPRHLMELGCRYAQKTVATSKAPRFVERQALLLLAIHQKPATTTRKPLTIHHYLHALLSGQTPPWQHQLLALFEVVSQITGTPETLASQCLEATEQLKEVEQKRVLDELAKRGGPFWLAIWTRLPKSRIKRSAVNSVSWAEPLSTTHARSRTQYLSRLFSHAENPFSHESSLIKLAIELLNACIDTDNFSPYLVSQIKIRNNSKVSWSKLSSPDASIKCDFEKSSNERDPRFEIPNWLADSEEARKVYWIGSILRAAAVGVTDFTGNRWKPSQVQSYKGLRTGWYKRRMGMMHAPEVLVGEFATISGWAAELLMKCLQWPGFESTHLVNQDIASFDSLESLRRILRDRLKFVDAMYCQSIDIPALVTKAGRPENRHEKGFRVVSVQQLLPRVGDFSSSDLKLDHPKSRSANRDHLARICQLTYKTLQANLAAENKASYPGADLIIFPELAIHLDDQDLIKRLADKTQSMIFAGLCFQEHNGKMINVARWFIPDYRSTGRQWIIRDQGKQNPMKEEKTLGIVGYRPCQHIIEVEGDEEGPFRISGAVCYDATDLKLAVDLKGKTDLFIIAAHNKDVRTFDAMATALNYHMYQHVVVVNKGEFGGSTIQAPYKESYDRLISHSHGTDQISINVADLDLSAFKRKSTRYKSVKAPPANLGPE